MSLSALTINVLKQAFDTLEKNGCKSRRVVSLGYPDILASPELIERAAGREIASKLRFRDDSASILGWHGIKTPYPVADADSLFEAMGLELDVIDLVAARGGELIHDLNYPLPDSMRATYAGVIDAGTMEHCFNIAQAARNIADMVAVGGVVMHGNPLNMYNHGFYNLNPTWYHDFYGANGFQIEMALLVNGPIEAQQHRPAPMQQRFGGMPENMVQVVIARRRELRELQWPIQSKYVGNPTLRG